MTKKTKMILGIALAGGVAYWLYTKYGKKSSTSNFAGFVADENTFYNASGVRPLSGATNSTYKGKYCKTFGKDTCCFDVPNPPIGTTGIQPNGNTCARYGDGYHFYNHPESFYQKGA